MAAATAPGGSDGYSVWICPSVNSRGEAFEDDAHRDAGPTNPSLTVYDRWVGIDEIDGSGLPRLQGPTFGWPVGRFDRG